MRESILIFGGKNLKEMEEDGGIGWWYVNQERAENARTLRRGVGR